MEAPPQSDRGPERAALLLLAGTLLAAAPSALRGALANETNATLLGALAIQGTFACVALAAVAFFGPRVFPEGLRLRQPALGPLPIAGLVVGFAALSQALSLGLGWLALRETGALGEIHRLAVSAGQTRPSFLLALLAVGVAPGIAEELVFRGVLQQGIRPVLGPARAIVLAALAFGVIHVDWVHGPAAFVLGLYLGVAAERGGSLWVAVLCHAVNNLLAVSFPALGVPPAAPWAGLAGAGLLAVAGLGLLAAFRAAPRNRALAPRGGA